MSDYTDQDHAVEFSNDNISDDSLGYRKQKACTL